jgi:hypothetical protein
MNKESQDTETPEDRLVDGLLGLMRPDESKRTEERVRCALDEVATLREDQRRGMRIWPSLAGALGVAAAVAIVVIIFISFEPASQNAIAEIDRTLERMTSTENRWYRIEIGRRLQKDAPGRVLEGLACTSKDGRFVAFMHHLGDQEQREIIVGNDGEVDWAIQAQNRTMPEPLLRMLFERLRPTVASGSVDPARILRLVRDGWNLERLTEIRDGRPVVRVEATAPAPSRGRRVIDHITLEIDPDTYSLERLEATRLRDGIDDGKAYLLFTRTEESKEIPGFSERDYLRTDRPRDPDPNS